MTPAHVTWFGIEPVGPRRPAGSGLAARRDRQMFRELEDGDPVRLRELRGSEEGEVLAEALAGFIGRCVLEEWLDVSSAFDAQLRFRPT